MGQLSLSSLEAGRQNCLHEDSFFLDLPLIPLSFGMSNLVPALTPHYITFSYLENTWKTCFWRPWGRYLNYMDLCSYLKPVQILQSLEIGVTESVTCQEWISIMQKDSQVKGIAVRMCCGWGKCRELSDSALVFAANKTLWSVAWQGTAFA